MVNAGASIEALLTLDATGFNKGIDSSLTAITKFKNAINSFDGLKFSQALTNLATEIPKVISQIKELNSSIGNIKNFDTLSLAIQRISKSIVELSSDTLKAERGINLINAIFEAWGNTLNSVPIKIENVTRVIREIGSSASKSSSALDEMKKDLMNLGNSSQGLARVQEQMKMMDNEFQRSRKELMDFARYGVQAFNQLDATSDRLKAQMGSMNAEFERSKAELLEFARYGRSQFEQVSAGAEKLAVAEEKVVGATNQATQSIQRQSSASRQATTSTEAQTQATNRLGKAMSSLRMIGTMVASMMVYNFAHSLITATRETVNAKSEMEGYFKMLHFNQTEIGNFNKALDETVGKFKRINKYALGETISSIGVEFNLTTQEMEKAMPVVSMITSEYLRAGRNVNEASLAVKDILQGEFQRLSRETGVKGDQLKEAGWSGDKNDVMGLLEALDTVGKSRNWDIFVTKANSLNDAVLILQNRFSEWSADMVNVVQPTILNVFNTLMTVGGLLSGVLEGAWKWLSGEGIANDIVRWTGLATAITGVAGALIHYRTGANLVQIAQMGLRGSITATVFGLKAEEVATYGSRNALLSKITSLKAEQVAELGVKKAIATKVLGLEAEMVANNGLKGAIMSSVGAKRLEEATNRGATVSEKAMIVAKYEEQVANAGTLRSIMARIAGVNMETFAEKGLIVALAERMAQTPLYIGSLKAEEIAELSTAEAGFILMGSLLPLTAILVGLAVAIYGLVKPLQDASENMKQFNNLVNDGDNIIKTHKKTYDGLVESYNATNEELQGLEANSKKYLRVQDKLDALEKDKQTAYDNWQNSIKAVEMARSRQAKYDEEKSKIAIHNQTELADAYIKAGLSSKEAMELTSHELNEAEKGAEQLRRALQEIKFNADKSASKTTKMIDKLSKYGMGEDRIKEFGKNMSEAQYKIAEGLDKFMTSDDLMERVTGWLELQQGRLEEWWTELNAFFDMRDWDGVKEKLWEGFKYILDLTPLGQMLEDFYNGIQEHGIVGAITEAIFGEGDSDGAWDIFAQFMDENVIQPVGSWLSWFFENPSAHWDKVVGDMSTALAYLLFGKNADGKQLRDITQDWLDNVVIPAITDAIKDYFSVDNILKGEFTFGGIGALTSSLPKLLFGEDASLNTLGEDITNYLNSIDWGKLLSDAFQTMIETISNIDFDLWGHIIGLIVPQDDGQKYLDSLSSMFGGFVEFVRNGGIGQWIQEQIGDWNLVDALMDAFSGGDESSDGGSGVAKQITADNLLTNLIDLSGIGTFIDEHIVRPFWDWLYQQLGLPLGEKVTVTQLIESIIDISSDAISTWVNDKIINILKDSVTQGILNTPVLGNVATFLGLGEEPQAEAQTQGQEIGTSFNTGVQTGLAPLDGIINTAFQGLNLDEVTANFTTNTGFITTNASSTATNVAGSFTTMKNNQKSSLDSMVSNNTNAFRDMHDKSNTQMLAMRDSTSNVTSQMTDAWRLMKDKIVDSANKIKTDSKTHFDSLSSIIKDFYGKIQNPSRWAGSPSLKSNRSPNRRVGRAVASTLSPRGYSGGRWTGNDTMRVSSLKKMICPNGDCGTLFNGLDGDEEVDVRTFLSMVGAKGHGFGGWSFADTHKQFIKTKSDAWKMGSPVIDLLGGIQTSAGFKVGEFNDGKPKITWEQFKSMAEAIFTAIPYRFYYDSSWKGSWLGALQAGACNCYDGALALIAFANACGFGGSMEHGTWTDPDGTQYAHVWARINGIKMDTTGWQQRGSWNAGSPNIGSSRGNPSNNKTVNVTVDMQGATIYGVDDLDSRIQESVQKGLQEEFNDSYTMAI